MPGCCLGAALLFVSPRVVLVLAWFFTGWFRAFDSTLVAAAGVMFAPWTTLAWMYTHFSHGGDVSGGYLVLFIVAVAADLGTYGAPTRRKRD